MHVDTKKIFGLIEKSLRECRKASAAVAQTMKSLKKTPNNGPFNTATCPKSPGVALSSPASLMITPFKPTIL